MLPRVFNDAQGNTVWEVCGGVCKWITGRPGRLNELRTRIKQRYGQWTRTASPYSLNAWEAATGSGVRRPVLIGHGRTPRCINDSFVVNYDAAAYTWLSSIPDIPPLSYATRASFSSDNLISGTSCTLQPFL